MRYYPIFLDLKSKSSVIIGGGKVAERKALGLLSAGAKVTVISPEVTSIINGLSKKGSLTIIKRSYSKGDLKGAFLAVLASNKKAINIKAHEEAKSSGVLVNAVDDPEHCDFIVPSIVDRGSLLIAISTSGKIPALSRKLREDLEKEYGEEYSAFVEILGQARSILLKKGVKNDKKEKIIKALVTSPLPVWIKENSRKEINRLLQDLLGKGVTLSKLKADTGQRAAEKDCL